MSMKSFIFLLCLIVLASSDHSPQPLKGALLVKYPPVVRWFNATLDHFSFQMVVEEQTEQPRNFKQKYLTFDKFWIDQKGPLFFFFGGEGSVEDFYNASGSIFELAKEFGALVVFLEHRYYGTTLPYGNSSYKTQNLRYLTVEQALADTAVFLSSKANLFGCTTNNTNCETVLFGGSYGGMLVAWFRLKYPHLSVGGIAASAPVDFWPGQGKQDAFYNATMNTFQKFGGGQNCVLQLEKGLENVRKYSRTKTGRSVLENIFHTCDRLPEDDIYGEKLSFYLKGGLATMAMLDYPYSCDFVSHMPANPVRVACQKMQHTHVNIVNKTIDDDLLSLKNLHTAVGVFTNFTGSNSCANVNAELIFGSPGMFQPNHYYTQKRSIRKNTNGLGSISRPWNYQAWFYPEDASEVKGTTLACASQFQGIKGRYNWLHQSFGNGIDLAKNLRNVIFSDAEKDPWRTGGVPDNTQQLSPDGSVLHYLYEGGAHHQDLREYSHLDSNGVLKARALERKHIAIWINQEKNQT